MAWVKVASYSFGFRETDKKYWLYYTLQNGTSATQVFLTAAQLSATVQMFSAATAINYETSGKYFTTEPRVL